MPMYKKGIELIKDQSHDGLSPYHPPRFQLHDLKLITLGGSFPDPTDTFGFAEFDGESDRGWSEEEPDYYS